MAAAPAAATSARMPTKRKKPTKAKAKKPGARRSPAARALAKGAFRPRVVKSKRAYTRKGKTTRSDDA